jgi:D-alanine-D-alanine ligase
MAKQVVAVMFGGRSVEHEVSVLSAHQVMDALEVAGYRLLPVFITKTGSWYAGRGLYNLKLYANPHVRLETIGDVHRVSLSSDPTVRQLLLHPEGGKGFFYKAPVLWADVFFPVLHGSFGEDGRLQGLLEMADVPYVGSGVFGSAAGMDKIRQKELYRAAGLPVLDCMSLSRADWSGDPVGFIRAVEAKFGFPVMAKPCSLGSSIGISRCTSGLALRQALDLALRFDNRALVEPALVNFKEINSAVMGPPYRASVCEMPTFEGDLLSFDAKYRAGGKAGVKSGAGAKRSATGMNKSGMASLNRLIPAPVSEEVSQRAQNLAIRAFEAVGAHGIARVDFLVDGDGQTIYVNEINTMPGSLAFYLWEASGVPFDKLVTLLVDLAIQRHGDSAATQFSLDANLLAARPA